MGARVAFSLAPALAVSKAMLMMATVLAMMAMMAMMAIVMMSVGGCNRRRGEPREHNPIKELYPRVTCQAARTELDEIAAGRGAPRTIVLRPSGVLVVDAKDVTGPAKLTCDGVIFAAVDAQQADPTGPIVMAGGPHAVLVTELRNGTLQVSQYCIGCNVVRGEKELKP